jgi:hypothetical protein
MPGCQEHHTRRGGPGHPGGQQTRLAARRAEFPDHHSSSSNRPNVRLKHAPPGTAAAPATSDSSSNAAAMQTVAIVWVLRAFTLFWGQDCRCCCFCSCCCAEMPLGQLAPINCCCRCCCHPCQRLTQGPSIGVLCATTAAHLPLLIAALQCT